MLGIDLSRARWRKSSRSGAGTNGNCVEVASVAVSRRESGSGPGTNGARVEVASTGLAIAVRDSKNPDGPALVLPASGWRQFLAAVQCGDLDRS